MSIPYIKNVNGQSVLMVEEKPFVMLSGEVRNSSSSTTEYMEPIWKRIKSMNLNSVLLPISWQLIEPQEGQFSFALVDGLIRQARAYEMKIGFLWFGSWKNAQCFYVPEWVKSDKERFKRAEIEKGKKFVRIKELYDMPYSTLSAFCEASRKADAKAFRKLMEHIREVDNQDHTVIMVQVENETGFLGSAREHSDLADKLFLQDVPVGLADYMNANSDTLAQDVRAALQMGKRQGSWQAVFGNVAEEVFSAYHVATYVDEVARAGKEAYPLPMAVNCWLVQKESAKPGQYPSGGPVARMMEVWKFAAPAIDIFAPDIYLPDFCGICKEYSKLGNPLFIPEAAGHSYAGVREVYAVGHHHAMCYAPFAIEELGLATSYVMGEQMGIDVNDPALKLSQDVNQYSELNGILSQLMPLLTSKYGTQELQAVIKEEEENNVMLFAPFLFEVLFDHPMIQVKEGGCLAVQVHEDEFIFAGCGCMIMPEAIDAEHFHLEYLSIEEGCMKDDTWHMVRKLNGDEERLLLNQPTVLKVKLNLYC